MKLSPIIHTLRHFSPSFEGRVSGATDFSAIKDTTALTLPMAYVVSLDDSVKTNQSQTDYWQHVTEQFGVIVVLKSYDKQQHHEAYDIIDKIKIELWRALLGLEPSPAHYPIQYNGCKLLALYGEQLFYQFNFSAVREVGFEDTRQYFDLHVLDHPITVPDASDGDNSNAPLYNPLAIGNFDTLSGTTNVREVGVTVNFHNNHLYEGNNDN